MKKNRFYSLLGSTAILLATTSIVHAQTAPTNDQLIDQILATAAPGATHVQSGDMLLSIEDLQAYQDEMRGDRQAASAFLRRAFNLVYWRNGVVPYVIDASVQPYQRDAFLFACQQWASAAQLTFVPQTTQGDYIRVVQVGGNVASSFIGRKGGGQDLKLPSGTAPFLAVHELGHALGLLHEHCRSDRNEYVSINFDNIASGFSGDFAIIGNSNNRTPYDFDSVMHYRGDAFSKNGGITIDAKPAYDGKQNTMGLAIESGPLSISDKQGMASIYGAPNPTRFPISGVVRNSASQPISGVTIFLTSNTSSMPEPVTTNSLGAYSFPDLLPGTYTVRASKAGYRFDSNPRQIQLSGASANNNFVGTLIPVSELPKLSVGIQRAREGNAYTPNTITSETTYVSIPITLSEPSQDTVSVDFTTLNDTALAGSDYVAGSGRISFPPGKTTAYVNVKVLSDTIVESGETFRLNISNPAGATIADASGAVDLYNDDVAGAAPPALPEISVSNPIAIEGDSGTSMMIFNVTLSAPATDYVGFSYTTVNAEGIAGNDYNAISGTRSFSPGRTTLIIAVPVLTDRIAENNEIFKLALSNPNRATIFGPSGGGTMLNDDVATAAPSSTGPSAPTARNSETPKAPRLARLELNEK